MSTKQKKQFKPLPIWAFIVIYLAVIIACVALDQLSKYLVDKATFAGYDASGHELRNTIPIFGNWLDFYWTRNTGANGGAFSNLSWRNWLFFAMTLVGIPVFVWLLWRSRTRGAWGQVAFSFIISGTIGNAIDRIWFAQDGFFSGSVRDFIRVQKYYGIFNVADSFLVVGVILAVLAIVFFDTDSLLKTILKARNAKTEQAATANSSTTADTSSTAEPMAQQNEAQQPTEQSNEQQDKKTESTDENG